MSGFFLLHNISSSLVLYSCITELFALGSLTCNDTKFGSSVLGWFSYCFFSCQKTFKLIRNNIIWPYADLIEVFKTSTGLVLWYFISKALIVLPTFIFIFPTFYNWSNRKIDIYFSDWQILFWIHLTLYYFEYI